MKSRGIAIAGALLSSVLLSACDLRTNEQRRIDAQAALEAQRLRQAHEYQLAQVEAAVSRHRAETIRNGLTTVIIVIVSSGLAAVAVHYVFGFAQHAHAERQKTRRYLETIALIVDPENGFPEDERRKLLTQAMRSASQQRLLPPPSDAT